MRTAVKRPDYKSAPSAQHFNGSHNPQREIRAKSTPKHRNIQRFGIPKPLPKPEPKIISGELVNKTPKAPAAQTHAPLPSMVASASHQRLERMLDQALTHADTHKEAARYQAARHFWQRRHLSSRGKWLTAALVLLMIIAGLLISWQKVPALSIKAAGMRAHLRPTVPTYKPDGYKLAGPAKAISGTVSIKYVSSDKNSSYEIIQAESNLTSLAVGQSVVPKGASVQTSQVEGNTVYIYDQNNDAAWVNNGVLYTIKDHANLSSDELIKIVQGLNP